MSEIAENIIRQLARIAAANHDKFYVRFFRRCHENYWTFQCYEQMDDHIFVEGEGMTFDDAAADAARSIKAACFAWEYTYCD